MNVDRRLDCSGLTCPIPVIRTAKTMVGMKQGEILEMTGTDPGSLEDVPDWCGRTGNELLEVKEDGGVYRFYIRKA
jgi:tRNA 2-thiouridine synthesizing protein A